LANGEAAEALTNRVGTLVTSMAAAVAASQMAFGGPVATASANALVRETGNTWNLALPIFKQVATFASREAFRQQFMTAHPLMRDMLSTLRNKGTPEIFNVLRRARVEVGQLGVGGGGIPTPYLWSGSQHYRKGKYVADHVFDPEAVSGQVGAAVLLKALIDLGAVTIDRQLSVEANPAAATGHTPSLEIDLTGNAFKHIAAELDYPGLLKNGSGGSATEKRGVRRVQEWLNLHDCITSIDSGFGDSTEEQLKKFQTLNNRQPTGQLDEETWALLTAPMRRTLAAIDHGASSTLEDAVIRVAQQHIAEMPLEVGGDNRGPWVRLYMQGTDGADQLWCAGFVCLMIAQAARDLKVSLPFRRQVGVDALVADAKSSGRFIKESDVSTPLLRRSKLRPGFLFVVRKTASDWVHVGLVQAVKDQTFDTLEGNTSGDGGSNGTTARAGNRSYLKRDFLRLL